MRAASLARTFIVVLAACAGEARAQDFAPSCAGILSSYQYTGKPEDQTLLAVVNGKLVDAFDAVLPPRSDEHQFYYIYHNKDCSAERPCVAQPIIAIKTVKVTRATAPAVVFLSREGSKSDWNIGKSAYDDFHNADETIPPDALSRFHLTYRSPKGQKLHTHYPKERRRTYLFSDVATGKSPWIKIRNYRFTFSGLPQCIPFTMQIQRGTESASIEVLEIEDGGGEVPQKIQRWPLKLGPAP